MGFGESKIQKKTEASKSIQTQTHELKQELKQNVQYANQKQMESSGNVMPVSPELIDNVSDIKNVEKEKQDVSYSVTETKLHMEQKATDVINGEGSFGEKMSENELATLSYGSYHIEDLVAENDESYEYDEELDFVKMMDQEEETLDLEEQVLDQKMFDEQILKEEEERKGQDEKIYQLSYGNLEKLAESFHNPDDQSSKNFQKVREKLDILLKTAKGRFDDSQKARVYFECYQEAVNYYNEHRGHRFTSTGKRRKDAVNDLVNMLQKNLLNEEFPNDVRVFVLQNMLYDGSETGFQSKKSQEFFNGEGQCLLKEESKVCNTYRLRDDLRVSGKYSNMTNFQAEQVDWINMEDRIKNSEYKELLYFANRFNLKEDEKLIYTEQMKNDIRAVMLALDHVTFQMSEENDDRWIDIFDLSFEEILDNMDQTESADEKKILKEEVKEAKKEKEITEEEQGLKTLFLRCYDSAKYIVNIYRLTSNKDKVRRKNDAEKLIKELERLVDKLPLQESDRKELRNAITNGRTSAARQNRDQVIGGIKNIYES